MMVFPPGTEITITNIKQMKIKIEPSEQGPISAQPQTKEPKAKKLPIKRQRVAASDSSDEDTIPLTAMVQKERRTKKRDDPKPPQKKTRKSEHVAQPSAKVIQPSVPALTPAELRKKKLEEEGLEDEEIINILRAYKNDLIMRSPEPAAVEQVPLRHFRFFLEKSEKKKPSQPSHLSQEDARTREALAKAIEFANKANPDVTPYLVEQDRLKEEIQSAQTALLLIEEDIEKMVAELPLNPSIQSEIDSAYQKKNELKESIESLKNSLAEAEKRLEIKTMNLAADVALKKRIEAASKKKAREAAEAEAAKERKEKRLRDQRAKIREEERAKSFQMGEEIRKHDAEKLKRSGETKEERMQKEFQVYLDELNAEQLSDRKKQKVSDVSAQIKEQAQEEQRMESVAQQLEGIHIKDIVQPEALQMIIPSRLPHYLPSFGPHHFRSSHPIELITPGTSLNFIKPVQPKGQPTRSERKVKIPGYKAPMFPPMPIPKVLRHTSLTDPKDLHMISRLEQERDLVKANSVLGTGPEGSLPRIIIRHNTQVLLAPDRMLPPISPPSFDKGKEEAAFKHPSRPQPFPKHNLLETTCIWAHELNEKNRAILASIPVARRSEWHAFRYLKDHHYQMIKASSGSGLTNEEKAVVPTH